MRSLLFFAVFWCGGLELLGWPWLSVTLITARKVFAVGATSMQCKAMPAEGRFVGTCRKLAAGVHASSFPTQRTIKRP
jgi:hypothetical protein